MHVGVLQRCDAAEGLMCSVLRAGRDLRPEYPLVFQPAFDGRLVVAADTDGEVRSTCATLIRDLVTPSAALRIGLIGSVATDPQCRGRGLASQVLAAAECELAARGAVFALLWADDPDFYLKRGYLPAGLEQNYLLEAPIEPVERGNSDAAHVRPYAPSDAPALQAAYERHTTRVLRAECETTALLAGPGIDTQVLERGGEVVAYVCVGRGEDLQQVAHEWGGAPDDVLVLLNAQRERHGSIFVMLPSSAVELSERLGDAGAFGQTGPLGMAKIVDLPAACELLRAGLSAAAEVALENGGEVLVLRGPAGSVRLDREELLLVLSAPQGLRAAAESVEARTGLRLDAFPLNPFVWGLDSI